MRLLLLSPVRTGRQECLRCHRHVRHFKSRFCRSCRLVWTLTS